MMQRVCRAESTQEKNEGLPTFLPLLRGLRLPDYNTMLYLLIAAGPLHGRRSDRMAKTWCC
jgi:hypothetical protein